MEEVLSQAEIIRRKKEKKKWKQEQLIEKLEKRKVALESSDDNETEKAVSKKKAKKGCKGRSYTVSVALPGSILDNAQSPELRTYLAGQVGRALAIFSVDEVVIFDDERRPDKSTNAESTEGQFDGVGTSRKGQGSLQLARILQFLECPQYLRKHFFPIHKDLQYAGVLNPTDMPHHLRAKEQDSRYREGIVLDRPVSFGKKPGSLVNIGLKKEVKVDKALNPGLRVTVELFSDFDLESGKVIKGKVVPPSAPRTEEGLYWGYTVRLADSLSSVFTKSAFKGGYDFTVGTSERGENVDTTSTNLVKPAFKHLLIVFGGLKGLEAALEVDNKLPGDDPAPLFDRYLNTCPQQGSRTIRTEEAILVTLALLRPKILEAQN